MLCGQPLAQVVAEFMKFIGRNSHQRGLRSHLISRHQAVEAIEHGVPRPPWPSPQASNCCHLNHEVRLGLVQIRFAEQGRKKIERRGIDFRRTMRALCSASSRMPSVLLIE